MNEKSNKSNHCNLDQLERLSGIEKLLGIMACLRDPKNGCPWDLAQSYRSILPFTIEEVYEVAEAIESEDFGALKDELGDLLFQIVFYAQIAKEEGRFDLDSIILAISEKLIRRHPHVFAASQFKDEQALKDAWETQKHAERAEKPQPDTSLLADIPNALPELKKAQKIQSRVARAGFDWPNVGPVWDKLEEESLEIANAAANNDQSQLEEEIGDLLFTAVNLSRHYGVDADIALRSANQKFERRFRTVEELSSGNLADCSLEQLEVYWKKAKQLLD